MSDENFWKKPETVRDMAIKGLSHVYFNTTIDGTESAPTHEQHELWGATLNATIIEYGRRETRMDIMKYTETRPSCPECKRPHGVAFIDGIFKCFMVDHKTPVCC